MPCLTELFLQTVTERSLKITSGGQYFSSCGHVWHSFRTGGKGNTEEAEAVPKQEQATAKGLVASG